MDSTAAATCDINAMIAAAGLTADMAFGLVYVRKQPSSGIGIPGTLRVDIPVLKFKGFAAVILEGTVQVWMKAEH